MALCFELESCYPDINPSIFTNTNLSSFLGKYVQICGGCYKVKNSTLTQCQYSISEITTSYDTCQECYGVSESVCGTCPEYSTEVTLDDGTVVCQKEITYPATFDGNTGNVFPAPRATSYSQFGVNLLEDITSVPKPILARVYNDAPSGGPANGYWNKFGFRDANGNTVFGQSGYSRFSNDNPPTIFSGNRILGNIGSSATGGRLNAAGIWFCGTSTGSNGAECNAIQSDYPDDTYTAQEFEQGRSPNNCSIGTYVKFTFCFTVPVEKQYTIGYAADNEVRILLDDNPLIVHKGNGGLLSLGDSCWILWNVVPITLSAGSHTITLIGYNYGVNGMYAAEVYDLSAAQLINLFMCPTCTTNPTFQSIPGIIPTCGANTIGNLGIISAPIDEFLLFSTKTYRDAASQGNPIQLPTEEGQYLCDDGSAVNDCSASGIPECSCVSNIPIPACCYKLTKCGEPTIIYTNSDLSQYQGQTVTINNPSDPTACYLVEQLTENCPEGAIEVTVTESYTSCETCAPSYKLYNCKDINVTVQTGDLSFQQYLGKTVKLTQYPGDCWQVGPNDLKTTPLEQLTVDGQPFQTCEECNVKTYFLTNCVNGVSVISTADLSAYVGKVITADNFPGLCFTVSDSLCNCLTVTLNGQSYEVNKESNLFNGKPYFQFTTVNNIPIVIAYDSTQNRWEVYNPDTQNVYFYSSLDIDCPATSLWVKLDPTFPGNITTETCPLSILNIEPSQEFVSCEPCVKC